MKSLCLFSGIGGITLALRDIATPLAYCDAAEPCRRVLETNMRLGRLPRAPVYDDVRTFPASKFATQKIDIVHGGFPCVGFSQFGKQEGFKESQSALFFEMMRVVEIVRPTFVFMENVPPIVHSMKAVRGALARAGYDDVRWCVVPAYAVGAPQNRARWFCLAVSTTKGAARTSLGLDAKYAPQGRWSAGEPVPRTAPKTPNYTVRIGMLGNAVVPDCVRLAWNYLFTGGRVHDARARRLAFATTFDPANVVVVGSKAGGQQQHGACARDRDCVALRGPSIRSKPDMKIVIDPGSFKGTPKREVTQTVLTKPFTVPLWATPRTNASVASYVCTTRTRQDLATQIRFAATTKNKQVDLHVNPEWIEWLQGYPVGWTRLDR